MEGCGGELGFDDSNRQQGAAFGGPFSFHADSILRLKMTS